MNARGLRWALAGALAMVALGSLAADAGARNLLTGFAATEFSNPTSSVRKHWLNEAVDHNAEIARISVSWANIAPTKPSDPANPNSSAYRWGAMDSIINDAAGTPGIKILLTVQKAPAWAEGAGKPGDIDATSSWKPDPDQYGKFAHALATRYGNRVKYYQAWNEPNLQKFLAPQWQNGKPYAPKLYRRLLNAFYDGVHSADSTAKVVAGGASPFGDPLREQKRVGPVPFLQRLFCLRGKHLHAGKCPNPAQFEVLGENSISDKGPKLHAARRSDVSIHDFGRVRRLLKSAQRQDTVGPSGKKPMWSTEFWWETNPPDSKGVPVRTHARWIQQAFYLLWKQHVQAAIMFEIRDGPCLYGDCAQRPNNFQTGAFYYHTDPSVTDPKPAAQAFDFPFVTHRSGGKRVKVWGKAPSNGTIGIQKLRNGQWRTIYQLTGKAGKVFTASIRLRSESKLRAILGSNKSLSWKQGG